jgi:hypothetical protein
MSAELAELATRFVDLSREIESVRDQMKRLLLNGARGAPEAHPPTPGGREPAKTSKHLDVGANSAAQDARVLELLRSNPNLKTSAIAKTLQVNRGTTGQRMVRLKERGAVTGGGETGWSVASPP